MLFNQQVPTPSAYGKYNITTCIRNDVVLANALIPTYNNAAASTLATLAATDVSAASLASTCAALTSAIANERCPWNYEERNFLCCTN